MRIGFVAADYPVPPTSGPLVRTFELVRALSRKKAEVELFCLGDRARIPATDLAPIESVARVTLVPRPPKPLHRKLSDALFEPWHLKGFVREFLDAIVAAHARRRFDVLHCEELRTALYALALRERTDAVVSLTHHNVESELFRAPLAGERRALRRAHGALLARRVSAIEQELFRKLHLTFSYSPVDHEKLLALGAPPERLHRTRCGCNLVDFTPALAGGNPRGLVFVGTLSYAPNVEAVHWFLDRVFPLLDGFELTVVGRSPSAELEARCALAGPRVRVIASPRDVRPYLAASRTEVVPILVGSGMRGKILEAFAAAKAVVSTTLGAEGIRVEHGKNILLADDPEAFASAVRRVAEDDDLARRLGEAARRTAEELYSWDAVADELLATYARFVR